MSIRQTYKMLWDGVEYEIKFTMELIETIDEAVNLMKVVQRCNNGELRITQSTKLIALVLNSAGANVTKEQVFDGLGEHIDASELGNITIEIANRCFLKTKKKSESQVKKPLRKRTRGKPSIPS